MTNDSQNHLKGHLTKLALKHCLKKLNWLNVLKSSPELKAQVSFSDHNLSVVHHHCCRPCKLFNFFSRTLGQFQPNLAQSIFEFKFIQMKDHALFQGETITKEWKYIEEIKNLIQNHKANFNQTCYKASLGEEDSSLFR